MTDRALSKTEAELVRWLLRKDFNGVHALREQVAVARVRGTWTAESASLDLQVEATAERSSFPDGPVPGHVWAYGSDGQPIGTVLLWVQGEALAGIEYGWVSEEQPAELASVASLRDHETGERGSWKELPFQGSAFGTGRVDTWPDGLLPRIACAHGRTVCFSGACHISCDGPRVSRFYEDPVRVEEYDAHRGWSLNPNRVMEGPAVQAALGSVVAMRLLDAGCGDGGHARDALRAGAAHVTAFDSSALMVDRARELLTGYDATVVQADLETVDVPAAHFDVVLARLCLHYVADVRAVLLRLVAALVPGGRLVLTVVHPLLTAPLALDQEGPREAAFVDDYFVAGPRERSWLGGRVTWHHRTVEEWVQAVLSSGLTLTTLSECPPRPELFAGASDELRRRLRAPSILLLAGQRP